MSAVELREAEFVIARHAATQDWATALEIVADVWMDSADEAGGGGADAFAAAARVAYDSAASWRDTVIRRGP